jgi:hypothetical protein
MDRVILHSDLNSFYASVECLYHPELRGKPVAVGGDEAQRHGIILTKTSEAKRYGVKTGEAIWEAKHKCPGLIVVPAHYDLYMCYSRLMHEIYRRYTDQIEPFGLDECWLDLTGSIGLCGDGEAVAQEIRDRIKDEIGLTVSVGVSWNKIFAKLGSDYKKPDAVTVISRKNYRSIVWPLPACDLLYVGPATTRKLARYGIHTIGQLAELDPAFLRRMPAWCVYIDAPGCEWGLPDGTLGFFAYLDSNSHNGHPELRITYYAGGGLVSQAINLTHDSLLDCLWDTIAEGVVNLPAGKLVPIPSNAEMFAALPIYSRPIAPLLYLCSDDPDIDPAPTRAPHPLYPYRSTIRYKVGYFSAPALNGDHASPHPHIRRAHWHLYRVGPGRSGERIRWIGPTPVGF